jgi:carbamoyltransferase
MNILGISAFYHDSAIALVQDGVIAYAAQEERFSRKKHDPSFPEKALKNLYEFCHLQPDDIDHVVFYEKPFLKFERLFSTYMQFAPRGLPSFLQAMPVWFKEKLFMKGLLESHFPGKEISFVKHHEAHAASAFYPSPFQQAAILTVDGVGEWDTMVIGHGEDNRLEIKESIHFPHSLGLIYSAFTYFTGFKVNSGEYKLMGLAPYGEPKYVQAIYDHLIDVKDDGSFRLNLDYFNYHVGLTMTNGKFDKLFGAKPRKPEASLRTLDMDLARSIQVVLEEVMAKIVRHVKREIGGENLVLAGGTALNCVANGKILKGQVFKDIWIQPAAGDAGGALGSALHFWYQHLGHPRRADGRSDSQRGSFLGPSHSAEAIRKFLQENGIDYQELPPAAVPEKIAELIDGQKVIGVLQGRMEYGPRALGHRSIIGDARSREMQKIMNLKIKFRESFRPFAPAVLEDRMGEVFDYDHPSRYMLLVYDVRPERRCPVSEEDKQRTGLDKLSVIRSDVPAITHVDNSARIHTVDKETNPFFYDVISAFYRRTGCPVVINTSFNVRGEPIVNTPQEAYQCFKHTNMDYLLLENFLIAKKDHDRIEVDEAWLKQFPMD